VVREVSRFEMFMRRRGTGFWMIRLLGRRGLVVLGCRFRMVRLGSWLRMVGLGIWS